MSAKILVVDDEADFVELIAFNLKQEGYEVITANTGLDGLFKARRFLPDLVVLDLMMEGIDGYSVCEILRRQLSTRTMPIIIVTAIAGQLARLNGLAVGAPAGTPAPRGQCLPAARRAGAGCQRRAGVREQM